MFPVLAYVYARLARSEEREVAARFRAAWIAHAAHVPPYLPGRPRPQEPTQPPATPTGTAQRR
jgi:protein-S-isoprenylcysteine O-methyltransferase Ste14